MTESELNFQLSITGQEIGLLCAGFGWLAAAFETASLNANEVQNQELHEVFEMYRPVFSMTRESLLIQTFEQAKAAGKLDDLKSVVSETMSIFEKLQTTALALDIEALIKRSAA